MNLRRRFLPVAAFYIAAILLASAGSALGQKSGGPGSHEQLPGGGAVTTEQFKKALERFGPGGLPDLPPELLEFFKDRIGKEAKKQPDEQQMKQALEALQKNPELRRQLEELGKKMKPGAGGGPGKGGITEEERRQLEKMLPEFQKGLQPNPGGGPPPFGNPMPPVPKFGDPPPPKFGDPPMPPPGPPIPPMGNAGPMIDPGPKLPPAPLERPNDKAASIAASLWERNIGPLDDTPAVKKALFEIVEGTDDFRDPTTGKSFWDELKTDGDDTGSGSLFDFLDGAALGDSWKFSDWELPKLWNRDNDLDLKDVGPRSGGRESWWSRNFGGSRAPRVSSPSSPRMPSGGGGGINLGFGTLKGGGLLLVILLAIAVVGFLVWRFWGAKLARNAAANTLFGPGWPIDPRRITTREHVVIAFEYLSVLICGPTAKTWTHNTIATALADLALTHGETAVMLARLYELARYAPLNEPMTTAELAEARRLVCALAGLEYE